jgi:hypothetical protein
LPFDIVCRCCCSAISNSPLAPFPFLLRLLLLSVTLFVPVTHNDMSLCACYTPPIYIYIIIHALNHSHPTFALCASAPQKLTHTHMLFFPLALFLCFTLSISFSSCFGYFCTFVLNVCLSVGVCVEKLCFCLAFSVCVFVPRRQRTLLPSRDRSRCTHASCPAPASSQCNALRKKWPGEWCVCSSPSVAHGGRRNSNYNTCFCCGATKVRQKFAKNAKFSWLNPGQIVGF